MDVTFSVCCVEFLIAHEANPRETINTILSQLPMCHEGKHGSKQELVGEACWKWPRVAGERWQWQEERNFKASSYLFFLC